MSEVTQELLKQLFSYDESTGLFTRLVRRGQTGRQGATAGGKNSRGYIQIRINGRVFKAHRLAWLYVHGVWPTDQIDHINGIKTDNRIENLRQVSNAENMQNRTHLQVNNSSGYRGVSWYRPTQKWKAQIRSNGKVIFLGYFDTAEEAHKTYLKAKAKLHPFANLEAA